MEFQKESASYVTNTEKGIMGKFNLSGNCFRSKKFELKMSDTFGDKKMMKQLSSFFPGDLIKTVSF